MKSNDDVTVTLGDGVATFKRSGSSSVVVANILGKEVGDKQEAFYLDRLVHKPHESQFGEFTVTGAISSILTRQVI